MKKNSLVSKLYSNELVELMNEHIDEIIKKKLGVEDIYTKLKSINESVRVGIYLFAMERDEVEVAEKVKKVNEMLNARRKKEFELAYKKNEVDKFLATLGKSDKLALMKDLGVDVEMQQRIHFTSEQRDYYDILSKSILEDQSNDSRDGIDQFVKYKKENN